MFIPEDIAANGLRTLQITQAAGVGSQLQAGIRAEMIDSPITKALRTGLGLMIARTMKILFRGDVKPVLNYAAIRPYAMMEAIRIALGNNAENKVILDPAGGYSPQFYWLAQEFTEAHFVEVDVHEVIEYKRKALYDFGIPSNLRLRPLDMTRTELHKIQSELVDVMVVLGAYVTHDEFRKLLLYLEYLVRDPGYLIVPFPYEPGIDNFTQNSFAFSKMIATPVGSVKSLSDVEALFEGTAFQLQEVIKLSDFAREQGKAIPADIEVIAIVKRG